MGAARINGARAVYALILLGLIFSVFTAQFLTLPNLANVGAQASVLIIVALGMTLIILSEGIDLSLGPCHLAGVILALCMRQQMPLAGVLLAILVGAAFEALKRC
jgi:ribose transport system permease protein